MRIIGKHTIEGALFGITARIRGNTVYVKWSEMNLTCKAVSTDLITYLVIRNRFEVIMLNENVPNATENDFVIFEWNANMPINRKWQWSP